MASRLIEAVIVEGACDREIADWLTARLSPVVAEGKGPVRLALPGGSTPFPIFEEWVKRELPWQRVTIVPTDDRDVPESDPASNVGRMRAVFEPVGAHVLSLKDAKATTAAGPFALVWLGMGADGHVASLFPNTDPRADARQPVRRITPDPLPPEAPFDRLTLTIPTLIATNNLAFVIRGREKRAVFDAAIRGESDLPIARLLHANASGNGAPVTCFSG